MSEIAPPIYDSKVTELEVFPNQEAAQDWLKKNELDTSGTPILVPFKDKNDKIHFLKPSNPNDVSGPQNEKNNDEANKNIRIIGAANNEHLHGTFRKLHDIFANHVSRLNELEGDSINLVDHGCIIIYKKGDKKTRQALSTFLEEEKERLYKAIKKAQTNEDPRINYAEFLEKLSTLAMDCEMQGGMCYFFWTDANGKQHVLRDVFKQDANNTKLDAYLKREQELHKSEPIIIKEYKSQNHHIIPFLKDWGKWTAFAAITAIVTGAILGIFVTIPLVAAITAVVTFISLSICGFYMADKNNPTTIEFGTPEFMTKPETTFSFGIKQRFNNLYNFIINKTEKTFVSPTENNNGEISTGPVGIFTTIVSTPHNLPVSVSNPELPAIQALVKSSLELFSFPQKNNSVIDDKNQDKDVGTHNALRIK
ncbi:MAG: hypothetical protein WAL30_05980 [Candidatus Aquirickettsiella sp.]